MSSTLSELIDKLQNKLIDTGTRFSDTTCTEAIRTTLATWNIHAPQYTAETTEAVPLQKEYDVTDLDDRAVEIIGVWEKDTAGDEDKPLPHDKSKEDGRVFFRLRTARSTGDLLIRYTVPHTINGLDSQIESTILTNYEEIFLLGAKAEAMQIRADSRVETINLQEKVSPTYIDQIKDIRARFIAQLKVIARDQRPATGEPNTAAWNDRWHGMDV